jgi:hypothetical protein
MSTFRVDGLLPRFLDGTARIGKNGEGIGDWFYDVAGSGSHIDHRHPRFGAKYLPRFVALMH